MEIKTKEFFIMVKKLRNHYKKICKNLKLKYDEKSYTNSGLTFDECSYEEIKELLDEIDDVNTSNTDDIKFTENGIDITNLLKRNY